MGTWKACCYFLIVIVYISANRIDGVPAVTAERRGDLCSLFSGHLFA